MTPYSKLSEKSAGNVYQGWEQRGFSVFLMKFGTAALRAELKSPPRSLARHVICADDDVPCYFLSTR